MEPSGRAGRDACLLPTPSVCPSVRPRVRPRTCFVAHAPSRSKSFAEEAAVVSRFQFLRPLQLSPECNGGSMAFERTRPLLLSAVELIAH